ncbi:MAG: translation initiation factor IF-3 [Elusimicrobia bacterium RIFCSPLOWO2_01_FULL_59_12]|nr:MAG: translation initiation factor IF-3 [Elusimicrobia bacterium RIFCSPLOWO2_01_FULL_59_12]
MAKPPEPRINHQIRVRDVRLIDLDGTQLGIKSTEEALRIAQNRGLDLVEIAAQNNPPVCKLADFSKFRYEREKKLKEARKKHKGGQVKELRVRPKIGGHDLQIKIQHMREFFAERDKVRFTIVFRGREMEHREIGSSLVTKVKDSVADVAFVEQEPQMEGTRMNLLFAPKK